MNSSRLILRLFLFLLLILATKTFSQQDTNFLQVEIDSLLSTDFFKSSQIAVDIYDLTNNKPLYQKNEKLLLRSASTLKILTTTSAFLFLDSYNFKTSVYHTGDIEDSICTGDIYFIGGFDPELTTKDLDSLVCEIKNYGIKEFRGNLYADVSMMDSLFWGEGWMWDDNPNIYAPYLTPLCINDNGVRVVYKPGEIGRPATIELIPHSNFFTIRNKSLTIIGDSSNLKISRDWINMTNEIVINGYISASAQCDTVSLNLFNPTEYFLTLVKESFQRNRISFTGYTSFMIKPETAEEIITIERSIDSVIVNTNKNSDNLSAEMIIRALASEYFGRPASAKNGIKLIDSLITIIGLDPQNFKIVDGSGLSFYNLISAELLVSLLKHFYYNEQNLFVKLYNSFPISGYDGTLKNRMYGGNAYKKVRAKTGTLSGVSNLSGYMINRNKHLIAFAILIQNFVGSSKIARDIQDQICEIIYNNN